MNLFKKFALSFLLACAAVSGVSLADTFAVTADANKQNIDMDALKKIFRGDVTKWDDGKAIVLVVPDLASPEGSTLLSKVYGMSTAEYKKFWMQKVFKGEAATPPESKAAGAMADFLKAYPNAIGILPAASAGAGLRKVLKID